MPSSPSGGIENSGAESLWYREPGKAEAFLKEKVKLSTPSGWILVDCGDSINFNPQGGVDNCGTEPSAFAINVFPDSPYRYEELKNDPESTIVDLKENIVFGGRPAVQFVHKFSSEEFGDWEFERTIIFYNEDAYLYITFNDPTKKTIYDSFLNNISFN